MRGDAPTLKDALLCLIHHSAGLGTGNYKRAYFSAAEMFRGHVVLAFVGLIA